MNTGNMKFMEKMDYGSEVKKVYTEFGHLLDGLVDDKSARGRLEFDLALEKLRRLYDLLLEWDRAPDSADKLHEELKDEPVPFRPAPEIKPDEPEPEPMEQIAVQEVIPEITTETKGEEPVVEIPVQPRTMPSGNIDLFSAFSVSGADNAMKETIGDKIQRKKIGSLKEAIGINEKFFFLNDLFGGNLSEYNKAIAHLDSLATHEEAIAYLETLQAVYNWNMESDAIGQLSDFVERKWK